MFVHTFSLQHIGGQHTLWRISNRPCLLLIMLLQLHVVAAGNRLGGSASVYGVGPEQMQAHQQLRTQADAQELKINLLAQEAETAEIKVRIQQQRQRALYGVVCLLALGLLAGSLLYYRLQRNRALLAMANEEILASMAEKEVLVQEIHHRVKNNLQLVSSLLGWQSSLTSDPVLVKALIGNQTRIQSMALVHEFLYGADNLAQVRLDAYLAELLNSLHKSLTTTQNPIKFTAELEAVVMDAKDATTFGLLINELVTNAYKHAFGQQTGGKLHISLTGVQCPHGFTLQVKDNGVGLPADGIEARPHSLGMHLIRTLTKQLKATITAQPNYPTGTCIKVSRA